MSSAGTAARSALYLPREVVEKLGNHEGDKLLPSIRGAGDPPAPPPTKGRGATGLETTLEGLGRESGGRHV